MTTTWTPKLADLRSYSTANVLAWHQRDLARTRCGAMVEINDQSTDIWFDSESHRDAWLHAADIAVLALIDPDGTQHLVTFNLNTGRWQHRYDPQLGEFLPPCIGTGPQFS